MRISGHRAKTVRMRIEYRLLAKARQKEIDARSIS